MDKKIAIGFDHAGFDAKDDVLSTLNELGVAYDDLGTNSVESVDYPDYARKVAEGVAKGEYDQGILVCGSGTGMAIAANKVRGIRAALAWNAETARLAREHNNANVLTIGSRTTPQGTIPDIIRAWFNADFEGGRHERRVEKIGTIEKELLT
ncbi:MAG: ribose 5-phosphate isomerase B [Acidobacteria bacterium]|nr:ribose 5-phosphate isomerase B [Acidobacteriota bacterium]